MNEIKNLEYANLFYVGIENCEMDRIQIVTLWNTKDIIVKKIMSSENFRKTQK